LFRKENAMNLDEMIRTKGFESFISDRLGTDLFLHDPDRANRLYEAAENGADGSLHSEVIQDWRDYLDTFSIFDPDYDEGKKDHSQLTQEEYDSILAEIDACEAWHEKNGSLYQEIG
jgi:hypothetical protein